MRDYNVCYLPKDTADYPTIWGEDHITLDDAVKAAFDFARTVRAAGRQLPFVWVETGDLRIELHVKSGRRYLWELSIETTVPADDGTGESVISYGAPDDVPLWTTPELLQFWDERERGEHRAAFPCAWDECDGYSRDLEPLMHDRYGIIYQCRKCREWTDSDCPPVKPLKPHRLTRKSALA